MLGYENRVIIASVPEALCRIRKGGIGGIILTALPQWEEAAIFGVGTEAYQMIREIHSRRIPHYQSFIFCPHGRRRYDLTEPLVDHRSPEEVRRETEHTLQRADEYLSTMDPNEKAMFVCPNASHRSVATLFLKLYEDAKRANKKRPVTEALSSLYLVRPMATVKGHFVKWVLKCNMGDDFSDANREIGLYFHTNNRISMEKQKAEEYGFKSVEALFTAEESHVPEERRTDRIEFLAHCRHFNMDTAVCTL